MPLMLAAPHTDGCTRTGSNGARGTEDGTPRHAQPQSIYDDRRPIVGRPRRVHHTAGEHGRQQNHHERFHSSLPGWGTRARRTTPSAATLPVMPNGLPPSASWDRAATQCPGTQR